MFDKLQQARDMMKLKQQADRIQKSLDAETVEVTKNSVTVKMTLAQRVVKLESNDRDDGDILAAVNEAFKESQKEAAKRMQTLMGGMEGLKGLLGG